MAKILCVIMAVSLYILTGCNKHLCNVNKGIDYPPKELDSLFELMKHNKIVMGKIYKLSTGKEVYLWQY